MARPTYKYKKAQSIVRNTPSEAELDDETIQILYRFYVLHDPSGSHSYQTKKPIDYGWPSNSLKQSGLEAQLKRILDTSANANRFKIVEGNSSMRDAFRTANLEDGRVSNIDTERYVISRKSNDTSAAMYLVFAAVRNCLAHGCFSIVLDTEQRPCMVMEDNDGANVTARMVLKLQSLVSWAQVVSRENL